MYRYSSKGGIQGFTLVELMVTLVVAAIILSIGIPSFTSSIRNNRTAAMTNELVTALHLARSEAVKRGQTVKFCPTTDGANCAASSDWQTGWLLLDASGNLLRAWDALSGDASLSGPAAALQYRPTGFLNATATVSFQLRASGCGAGEGRDISVSVTGRPSVAKVDCP